MRTSPIRRRTIRHSATLDCRVFVERSDAHIVGRTLDVSTEGVRMLSDAAVSVGEPVVLTMHLPNQRAWVDAHGRVARIEEGVRDGDPGRTIAFEFTAMDQEDRYRLYYSTQSLPPPLPRRSARR